jgi:hypothetical protein
MKSFVRLFAIAALFGLAIALAYWLVAHREAAGTALLGIMAMALAFTAGYAVVAERDARLESDDPAETMAGAAGEDLGVFTTHSAWPPLVAICALAVLVGLVWLPLLCAAALVALVLSFWRLGAESARA